MGGLVRCELGAAEQITQLRNTAHFDSTFNKGESLSICLTITRPRKRAGGVEKKKGRKKKKKKRNSHGAAGIPFVFSR